LAQAPETPAERRRALAARLEKNDAGKISAFAIAFTGFCLLLGSWYRTGGIDTAGWIGIAGFVIGFVWLVWLINNAKQWKARLREV
jgi:hypothetical protein